MRQSHGCEPPDSFLFDNSLDLVVVCAKLVDQGFCFCIARQRHREVGIAREPRFGPGGHGQAADQGKRHARSREVVSDPPQRGFERGHPRLRSTFTRRPGQSPDSAPCRWWSHCRSRRSISSSVASG